MADEPFLDTHVHFWDHAVEGLHWPWLEPGFAHANLRDTAELDAPRYTPPEFLGEAAGAEVGGLVHIQATGDIPDPVLETAWLQGLADLHGLPTAIVGSCFVGRPGAVQLLERHAQYPALRGVRDIGAAGHLDVDEAAPALSALERMGLSFEARRRVPQLDRLEAIADRWPGLTLVLSHACLPHERTEATRREYAAAAARLAARPNVVCKISAVAGASDPQWTVDSIRPWIHTCIEAFGAARCMLGTNWPIDRLFASYPRLVEAYREVVATLVPAERAALLHGTAEQVYGVTIAS